MKSFLVAGTAAEIRSFIDDLIDEHGSSCTLEEVLQKWDSHLKKSAH